ncbi:MAG: hypothetical protein IKD68_04375, partial [Solobacterium sp.]|nr:hypothetical protein [Solobacterium sp.]
VERTDRIMTLMSLLDHFCCRNHYHIAIILLNLRLLAFLFYPFSEHLKRENPFQAAPPFFFPPGCASFFSSFFAFIPAGMCGRALSSAGITRLFHSGIRKEKGGTAPG